MRSYPAFTSRRLALARTSLPPQRAEDRGQILQMSFVIPDLEKLSEEPKGVADCQSVVLCDGLRGIQCRTLLIQVSICRRIFKAFADFKQITFIYQEEYAIP